MGMPAMVVPVPEGDLWTVGDLERLPADGNRYEILHGELLVTPLPSHAHQGPFSELVCELMPWARRDSSTVVGLRPPAGVRSPGKIHPASGAAFRRS
jgi:Uma2 family endonuclease